MSDLQLQLAALRAEADQELAADGECAEVTLPARVLLLLLDSHAPQKDD